MTGTKLKVSTYFNGTILCYILLVGLLQLIGKIRFGHGLGDLFHLIFIAILILFHLGLTLLTKHKVKLEKRHIWYFILGTIFLIIAIKLTWDFTYGRGIESKWDGHIFN